MISEEDKFEKIRELLSNCPAQFCMIFRGKQIEGGWELRWCKAASADNKSNEEYDKLADTYREIVLDSFQNKQVFILRENQSNQSVATQRRWGFNLPIEPKPAPADSQGKRRWHFVIGSGATHNAGYAIVSRISAKDKDEVKGYIAKIQEIMSLKSI